MAKVETEPEVFSWPPSDGTYRIRNLNAGGFWQLATSKKWKAQASDARDDKIKIPSWVEVKHFEKYCEAQQWILTFLHAGFDNHSGFYKITCVQGNTAIANNLLPFGAGRAATEFDIGPMSSEKEDDALDVWYLKGLEVDGKKFTRIYPAHKSFGDNPIYEYTDGACESHSGEFRGETFLFVRIFTRAKDDELCARQDWVFQTVEDKKEKDTAGGTASGQQASAV